MSNRGIFFPKEVIMHDLEQHSKGIAKMMNAKVEPIHYDFDHRNEYLFGHKIDTGSNVYEATMHYVKSFEGEYAIMDKHMGWRIEVNDRELAQGNFPTLQEVMDYIENYEKGIKF